MAVRVPKGRALKRLLETQRDGTKVLEGARVLAACEPGVRHGRFVRELLQKFLHPVGAPFQ